MSGTVIIDPCSEREVTKALMGGGLVTLQSSGLAVAPGPSASTRAAILMADLLAGEAVAQYQFAETKSDIAALLLPGLKTVFADVYGAYPAFWTDVTTVVPSDKDTESYGWLGAVPGMQEFIDERQIKDLATYSYAIKNKTWESTIAVDRTALEDDLTGQLAMRVRQMAEAAKTHLDVIIFGLLASGFTALCYDGAAMFASHTSGKPGATFTQDNHGTDALGVGGLQSAITVMQRFMDDAARPMGIQPDTLVVPPELAWTAWTLMNSAFYPDPVVASNQQLGANPLRGMLKVVSCPYLTNHDNWFLLDTKRVIKAVILQMRKDFEFDALEMNTETGFLRDKYYYGVRARYNVGFGEWRCAFGSHVS